MDDRVKKRRKGYTRISSKHQTTIPMSVMEEAGLGVGDELKVEVVSRWRVILVKEKRSIMDFAGALTGVYPPGYLEELRSEWDE